MIQADLHMHTCFSHGVNAPLEMYLAAKKRNLKLIGFTEHSPRPEGYNYTNEYRERLSQFFPEYINQVTNLKKHQALSRDADNCQVLLGLEVDWLNNELEFIEKTVNSYEYDYIIGSVHFLDKWGFDDNPEDWKNLSQEECENIYEKYFKEWNNMLKSKLFNIAAHPDLIKIFSVEKFHIWLLKPESHKIINDAIITLRDSGMSMEISSAGLRKPCKEIYPNPLICEMAFKLNTPISFASDAHNVYDVGFGFEQLADYARSFGYTSSVIFNNHKITQEDF